MSVAGGSNSDMIGSFSVAYNPCAELVRRPRARLQSSVSAGGAGGGVACLHRLHVMLKVGTLNATGRFSKVEITDLN
jgi:hypothetical protein